MRSPVRVLLLLLACAGVAWIWPPGPARADDGPAVPRIDSVVMSSSQPHQSDEAVIWYDDFDGRGGTLVWRSNRLTAEESTRVDEDTGTFLGPLGGQTRLAASTVCFFRVRQQNEAGQQSAWSPWHQPVKTESEE